LFRQGFRRPAGTLDAHTKGVTGFDSEDQSG
jgi:hypothetical protein